MRVLRDEKKANGAEPLCMHDLVLKMDVTPLDENNTVLIWLGGRLSKVSTTEDGSHTEKDIETDRQADRETRQNMRRKQATKERRKRKKVKKKEGKKAERTNRHYIRIAVGVELVVEDLSTEGCEAETALSHTVLSTKRIRAFNHKVCIFESW